MRLPIIIYPARFEPVFTPAAAPAVNLEWHQRLTEPTRRRATPARAPYLFAPLSTSPETTTVDRWFRQLAEPTRRKVSVARMPAHTGPFNQAPPEPTTPDKWLRPLETPTRRRVFPTGEYPFLARPNTTSFPEAATADRWYRPLSEPARFRRLGRHLRPQVVWPPSGTITPTTLVPVTGIDLVTGLCGVSVWTGVDDSQTPGWSEIATPSDSWSEIDTSGGGSWTPIDSCP